MVKIAVGSLGSSLDAWVGGRFGYCPQFVIVDSETMEVLVVPMPPVGSEREASAQAIRTVARNGADVLIVQRAMPECRQVMDTLGIEVLDGVEGLTVRQAVERYLAGQLSTPEGRRGEPSRIAIAALGRDLDAPVGAKFDAVSQFIIVDPGSMAFHVIDVAPAEPGHPMRLATIRSLATHGVNLVLTPIISPVCAQALWSLAIEVILVEPGQSVRQVVEQYRQGLLNKGSTLRPKEATS